MVGFTMPSMPSMPMLVLAGLATAHNIPVETHVAREATFALDIPHSQPTKIQLPNAFGSPEDPNKLLNIRAGSPTLAEVAGATYIGCFQNGSNDILTVTDITDFGLTPELCRNLCKLENVPYFAMERGRYCHCGQQIEGFAVRAPESECNQTCEGATVLCGGTQRANVYSITDSAATDPIPAATTTVEFTTTDADGSVVVETSIIVQGGSGSGSTTENNSNEDKDTSKDGSESSDSTVPIGAIVGGVVGGVALIAIISSVTMYLCFRRMKQQVAEARAEAVAARTIPPVVPSNHPTSESPGYGFVGSKPEGNIHTTHTAPTQDMHQQALPLSVSPMAHQEGHAALPQAVQLPLHGIPPPSAHATDIGQQLPPQELNDTDQRVYEMGTYYRS